MARHPNRQRRPKPKHRRTCTQAPSYEYDGLRERRIRTARWCLVALVAVLNAIGIAYCIFR